MSIPLFWKALNKAGSATAQEHMALIQRFIDTFGVHCIAGVLTDREFANQSLLAWCNSKATPVPFYVRAQRQCVSTRS